MDTAPCPLRFRQRATVPGVRLKRDLSGILLGGPVGGSEVTLLATGLLLGLFAIARSSALGAVLAAGLLATWALHQTVRVRLDHSYLIAGHIALPRRWKRDEIQRAEAGKVAWGRGFARGIKLVLNNGDRVDLPLSAMLLSNRVQEWISTINDWAGYKPPPGDPSSTPLRRFISDRQSPHDDNSARRSQNRPPDPVQATAERRKPRGSNAATPPAVCRRPHPHRPGHPPRWTRLTLWR